MLYFLKDTLTRIKADYEYATANGFKIAGKLVRGAYMAEERQLAAETGSEDPINEGYDKTTEMYHSVVDFVLPLVKAGESGFMIATHNENTILYVLRRYIEPILNLLTSCNLLVGDTCRNVNSRGHGGITPPNVWKMRLQL